MNTRRRPAPGFLRYRVRRMDQSSISSPVTNKNVDDLRKNRDIVPLHDQVGLDSSPNAVNTQILTTAKGLGGYYPILRCDHKQGGPTLLNGGPVHPA